MDGINFTAHSIAEDSSISVFVLSASEDVARRIESELRNAGHPLRTTHVANVATLAESLADTSTDLLLCEDDLPTAPLDRVLSVCRKQKQELPLVLICSEPSAKSTAEAMAAGARDCVSARDAASLSHLTQVVGREIITHRQLRDLDATHARLQAFQTRHQQLAEGTGDPVAYIQEGVLTGANTAFAHLLGHDAASAIVGTPLIDLIVTGQQNRIKKLLRNVLMGKHDGQPLELAFNGRDGRVDVKAEIIMGAADGERAIELLVRKEQDVPKLFCGPGNGGRAALASAMKQPVPENLLGAILLVRIDDYGNLEHRVGLIDAEEIRDQIAKTICEHLHLGEALFTFSNAELSLLIARPGIDEIETFTESLRANLSGKVFATGQHEAQVTVSVAAYPRGQGQATEAIVRQLATEVAQLSSAGGDRICIFGESAAAKMAERETARIVGEVRKAMKNGQLRLAYQSIASLEGDDSKRFDIVLRLIDKSGNAIHAGEFLPQVQQAGMMREIDQWVVARALQILTQPVSNQVLFVKWSEDTLRDGDDFLAWLKPLIAQSGLQSDRLVVEIQELAAQNQIRKAKVLTQALRELGVGVALEQFGAGVSSVRLLDHLPVGYVKFHPDFTRNFGNREIQRKLGDLLSATKERRIKTIVSYVEDTGTMARMWQMGVNFVQGFYIHEPETLSNEGRVIEHRA